MNDLLTVRSLQLLDLPCVEVPEEYDEAQDRGEVQKHGGQTPRDVGSVNIPTAADLGLRRDEIHEARKLRDAETALSLAQAHPGIGISDGKGRYARSRLILNSSLMAI